jgi:8-hydroxy-5-deazaflavin:NADPH oxidoreductase
MAILRLRHLVLGCLFVALVSAPVRSSLAASIAIIGTGRVAAALGPRFAKLGHEVIYGSREPNRAEVRELVKDTRGQASATTPIEAARRAEIVVLAVPGTTVESVVMSLGSLSGKIVIDPTNPTQRAEDGLLEHGVETSNAEIIQKLASGARVVKAFNTVSAQTMADPASAGGPVTIPIVGDDPEAKATVTKLVEALGFDVIDLGPVRYAHVVEGMLVVWMNARVEGRPFDYYLRKPPQRN